jgi:nicotinamidase-related amidase
VNRTAILFIDFQRDFLEADGRLTVGKVRAKALLDQAAQLLEAARGLVQWLPSSFVLENLVWLRW